MDRHGRRRSGGPRSPLLRSDSIPRPTASASSSPGSPRTSGTPARTTPETRRIQPLRSYRLSSAATRQPLGLESGVRRDVGPLGASPTKRSPCHSRVASCPRRLRSRARRSERSFQWLAESWTSRSVSPGGHLLGAGRRASWRWAKGHEMTAGGRRGGPRIGVLERTSARPKPGGLAPRATGSGRPRHARTNSGWRLPG
jgi:hypothetical protein